RLLGSLCDAGRQKHLDSRMIIANPLCEAEPAEATGQLDVSKNNIDLPSRPQDGDDILGRDAFNYGKSALAEIGGDDHPHQNLRLNHKYRAWRSLVASLL